MRTTIVKAAMLALALAGAVVEIVVRGEDRAARAAVAASAAAPDPVSLREAVAVSRSLGPVPSTTTVDIVLAFRPRHAQVLQHLLDTGEGGRTPDYASFYGPDPSRVRAALAAAQGAGLRAGWRLGQGTASLEGPARTVEAFFHVRLSRYETPSTRTFFAADGSPVLPRSLRGIVDGVAGLDDYERIGAAAIPAGGVTPQNVSSFYDVSPLRAAGLDGAGETVVFPEINSPADVSRLRSDLDAFSSAHGLPPANLTARTEAAWHPTPKGGSDPGLGEADLDVEIVHSIAPGAKLIVYEESTDDAYVGAESAMVSENPAAIISDSVGQCEGQIPSGSMLRVLEQPWLQQAAANMTHYAAAGDDGAYGCGQNARASIDFPSDLPIVTAVGGTSVLLAADGGYYTERAWGNALTKSGGGGGVSSIFKRPPTRWVLQASPRSRARPVALSPTPPGSRIPTRAGTS